AILLVLAGVGAGGYWYLAIRNPTLLPGLLDRAKQLASRITKRSPAPPPAAPRRRTTAGSPPAAPPAAPPPPAPPPAAARAPARVSRDQALWASVDSVSRRFDDSGCPRP